MGIDTRFIVAFGMYIDEEELKKYGSYDDFCSHDFCINVDLVDGCSVIIGRVLAETESMRWELPELDLKLNPWDTDYYYDFMNKVIQEVEEAEFSPDLLEKLTVNIFDWKIHAFVQYS